MKSILKLLIGVLFIIGYANEAKAQRYLTEIFNSANSTSNISYGSSINYLNFTQSLFLDFYEPTLDTLIQRPLIIYIHGGGFTDSNNYKSLSHIVTFCETMAKKGYAVASIDYRLDTSSSNRAIINAMHDAKAAVRFFRANAATYKIDTSLIFIGGESAGAITALTSTYINTTAEVLYPTTLPYTLDGSIEGNSGNPNYSSAVKAIMCNCGGTETAFNDPMFDTLTMQTGNPPILIVHGTADPLVPFLKSAAIAKRANHIGIPNLFYAFKGATHCPWFVGLPNQNLYLDSLIDYTTSFLYPSVITSISSNKFNDQSLLKVFPNPVGNILNVKLGVENVIINEIKINTLDGKMQKFKKVQQENNQLNIDISTLIKGVYFIQIKTDETIYSAQFIKI